MLVDVNFIEKKRTSRWNVWIPLTIILIFAFIFSWFFYQYNDLSNSRQVLEQQIQTERDLREVLNQNREPNAHTNQHLNAILTLEKYPISITHLIKDVTETVPSSAVLQQFAFNTQNQLVINIQSNDKPSVAAYLKMLKTLPSVNNATITDLSLIRAEDGKNPLYNALIQIQIDRKSLQIVGETNE